jgi:hypothetical protein
MGIPHIAISQFLDSEKEQARHVTGKLFELATYADQFGYAVALFDEVEPTINELRAKRFAFPPDMSNRAQTRLLQGWQFMAARDAAMNIYHFRSTLASIITNIKKCHSMMKALSIQDLEAAASQLEADFPALVPMRHAVAHSADTSFSPQNRATHSFDLIGVSGLTLSGVMSGRTMAYTHDGAEVSVTVTDAELAKLRAIVDRVYLTFDPLTVRYRAPDRQQPLPN